MAISKESQQPAAAWTLALYSALRRGRALVRRAWWVVVACISIAICIQSYLLWHKPPAFLSSARMTVSGRLALPEGGLYREEGANFYGTQTELMMSALVRSRAEARVEGRNPELQRCPVDFQVSQLPRASIFVLRAIGSDPAYTRAYLEACMEEYIALKREMRSTTSETTLTAITDQLTALERELQAADDALIGFQKRNNVGFLEEEGNSAGVYLATLKRKMAGMKTEFELLNLLDLDQNLDRAQKLATAGDPASSESSIPLDTGPEAEYLKAKQQLQLLKVKRQEQAVFFKPKHPALLELDDQIAQQERLIEIFKEQSTAQIATRRESLKLQMQNLDSEIKEWETKALDLSERIAEFNKLKSKKERAKALYERLLGSMQSVDVNKSIDQDAVTILEHASLPVSIRPGMVRSMFLALLGGLAVSSVILYVIGKVDDQINSVAEFQLRVPTRILGQIGWEKVKGGKVMPINPEDDRHLLVESFSNIRSSILYLPYEDARPKTLIVTSAIPNDGKTLVACNLAITMALGGMKILLVDCDLRRGGLHDFFRVPNTAGFSNVLEQTAGWRDVVMKSQIENLSVMPRGPVMKRPSKYLLSADTDSFLKAIYPEFDFIIFDTCPVLAADDTTSLAPKIDATIFVTRLTFTPLRSINKALELLRDRQVNILGAVLNGVDTASAEYDYYHYPEFKPSKLS